MRIKKRDGKSPQRKTITCDGGANIYLYRVIAPLKTDYYELEKDSIITATYNLQKNFELNGRIEIIGMLCLPRLFILQNKGQSPQKVIVALDKAQNVAKEFIVNADKIKGVLRSVICSNKKALRK